VAIDHAPSPAPDLAAIQQLIRERSPLPPDRTEEIIGARFGAISNRLSFALANWPLATSKVVEVGCASPASTPTLIIEAAPDPDAPRLTEEAERKNKQR
jgi:hypothetical protein